MRERPRIVSFSVGVGIVAWCWWNEAPPEFLVFAVWVIIDSRWNRARDLIAQARDSQRVATIGFLASVAAMVSQRRG